ncbi:putative phospholipase B-like 2 [Liolophura sinensis]|uniref:putative phospholipase B-like 2 n=1 Tax=Liolophura sinensis TaxID=3198878 RepID=UPI00315955DA
MAVDMRQSKFAWFLLASTVLQLILHSAANEVYITYDSGTKKFVINHQSVSNWVAYGNFTNKIDQTGWSFLDIVTEESFDDHIQAYAAGLAEGFLTSDLITLNWENTVKGYCQTPLSPYCTRLQTFLQTNLKWMYSQIEQLADNNPLWHQVMLLLIQLNALHDGYVGISSEPSYVIKDPFGFLMFQIGGDLEDLESALNKEDRDRVHGSGSCSALIKLLPDNADLYVSHDTWSGFETMLRILKKYDFGFHMIPQSDVIPGRAVSFSSYPGVLYSGDDFYILSSGLVTMETTIGNGNPDLWKKVKPTGQILEGIRTIYANRMAETGLGWSSLFQMHNSGTYNNEWMVIDYKQFTPNKPLPKYGVLVVLEQLPGFVKYDDLTWLLANQSYFPSYNIPYFQEVFNMSGGQGSVEKFGDWFSYDHAPRANIFRRDHHSVIDISSMVKLMRYNDFQHDPFARCNCTPPYSGENAISARSDLNPADGKYPFSALGQRLHGGTDMKMTSYGMYKSLSFLAISGPTFDQQPPFQWSTSPFANKSHLGIPDLMKFEPQMVSWMPREKN